MNSTTTTKAQNEILKYKAVYNNKVTYTRYLKNVTLGEIIDRIKRPDFLKEHTDKLRTLQNDAEQQEYKKNNFPYFILGSFKENHRLKKNLISSSFFVFDYDHLDEKLPEMKKQLSDDPTVLSYFVSPRGNGLKVIYRLESEIKDCNEFSRLYKQYAAKFNINLGTEPDKTSDASRACYFSYDPDIYVNLGATPLPIGTESSMEAGKKTDKTKKKIEIKSEEPGSRTETATQLIGKFIKSGMNENFTLDFMQLWNKQNNPPLSEDKISDTVKDLYSRYKKSSLLAVQFEEKNNNYYKTMVHGNDIRQAIVTSFKIVPKELLVLDNSDCLKCDIVSSQGITYKNVLIENTDWHSKQKFLKALGHQDCVFLGSDNDLQALCQFTQTNITLRKTGTKVIGLNDDIWVIEGANITKEKISKELSIVPFDKGSDAFYHRIKYLTLPEPEYKSMIGEFYEHILNINERNKVLAYLGWVFVAPMKQKIQAITGSFPLLFNHGGQGSGKTSQAELFARLSGYQDPKPNSVTMKSFPLLKMLSSTNAIPQWYDEFKVSDMKDGDVENILRFMRKAYSGEQESKGRADQTIENYKISAPMVVMGEWNINQPAIMERVVLVRSKDVIKNDKSMQHAFSIIQALPLEAFMPEYIRFCLGQDIADILETSKNFVTTHFREITVAPRIMNNMAVMITGLELFRGFAHPNKLTAPDIDYGLLLDDQLMEITGAKNGKVKSAVDQLIEELAIMAGKNELMESQDYKIVKSQTGRKILAIKFREVFRTFKVYAKKTNYEGDLLDEMSYSKLFDDCDYVFAKDYMAKFFNKSTRCLGIDMDQANNFGVCLDGFEAPSFIQLQQVTDNVQPQMFEK